MGTEILSRAFPEAESVTVATSGPLEIVKPAVMSPSTSPFTIATSLPTQPLAQPTAHPPAQPTAQLCAVQPLPSSAESSGELILPAEDSISLLLPKLTVCTAQPQLLHSKPAMCPV